VIKANFTKLKAGVAPLAVGFALLSTPAYAQDAVDCDANPADAACVDAADDGNVIVVTGSILRRTNTETPSPVTVLSSETLEERGLNTVSEAVQRIPSNNAGTITQGWNTGFNFASGANAPALRGLTVQSTLSIVDGLRIAPYPLADDGQRNFVDLNTIPDAIVDRIEILRDGASSTYGADAIAGVINVITKKEIQGLHLGGSLGSSQRGDAEEYRVDLTWGYGDLAEQGFNFYVSGEYQKQSPLYARDRGYPYNTADWTQVCGDSGSCMYNLNWNSITPEDPSAAGFFAFVTIPGVTMTRRVTAATPAGGGAYTFLNPAAGCRGFDRIDPSAYSGLFPQGICEVDPTKEYLMFQPEIERRGLSGRLTFGIGDSAELYVEGNYYNTKTFASFTPLGFNGTPTPPNNGVGPYNVIAPVYVCPTGIGTLDGLNTGCTAANGTLNPYNPYAAQGDRARLFLRNPIQRTVEPESRTLRGVIGLEGSFGNDWRYSASFTGSENKLTRTQDGYIIPQRLADVVARGTFNFADPMATPQAVWDYISPSNVVDSVSKLWQVQATIAKDLFDLPGGPLQVAVGGAFRDESINAPSANPGTVSFSDNQYDRFYSINSVGTAGSRTVTSGFFEIDAPIIDPLEVSFSGRYDKYSTGQKAFSPKVGAKFTPIPEIAIRGTWSKGFRIPSFNEAFGLPTTGYVTRVVNCATFATFCAAHGNNAYATGNYPLGLTSVGNPALDPERSTAFTAGIILEPTRNLNLTVDFWRIKVKDLITSGSVSTATIENAYYANNGVVNIPGVTVLPGQPDPQFPNALPLLGFIETSFINSDKQVVSGFDFGANFRMPIGNTITWRSSAEASLLTKYHLTSGGTTFEYEDTLSPCNITSCSGAPKWRALWQNTIDIGEKFSASLTAYYTQGYDTASVDFGGVKGDCLANAAIGASTQSYVDGTPVACRSPNVWNADLTMNYDINDNVNVFLNVLNVFDIDAPFDPASAYHIFGFNPAWSGPNILGRYFRLGAKIDF